MPSSTSNSDERLPQGPWGKTWLLAICTAAAALALYEGFWRLQGFRPTLTDNAELWAQTRCRVHAHDRGQIVLVGSSRIQQAINTDEFARCFAGRRPVQLAIRGSSGQGVFKQLSEDERFCGIVIFDVTPTYFFRSFHVEHVSEAEYLKKYSSLTALSLVETWFPMQVQKTCVFRLPQLAPQTLAACLKEKGALPAPLNSLLHADRSRQTDFTMIDARAREQLLAQAIRGQGPGISAEQLLRDLEELDLMVKRIHARGGQVVFVHLPISGAVAAAEEAIHPRAHYWDMLATHTSALTLHFADYPTLQSFVCGEGSHLDYRDALPFTHEFCHVLKDLLAGPRRQDPESLTFRATPSPRVSR